MVNESYWQIGADFARRKKLRDELISPSEIKLMEMYRQITWQQHKSYWNGYDFAVQQIEKENSDAARE